MTQDVITRWIVDPSGAVKGAETASSAVDKSSDRMVQAGKKADKSFKQTGKNAEQAGKKIKTAMDSSRGSLRGFEKGLSVAAVSSGAAATTLSGAAREILLTGTALGATGAALSAVGLGIGFVGRALFSESESVKRARERLDEQTKSAEDRARALAQQAKDLDEQFRKSQGFDVTAEKVRKLDKEYAALEERLTRLRRRREFEQASERDARFSPAGRIINAVSGVDSEDTAEKEAKVQRQLAANRDERSALLNIQRTTNRALETTLKLQAEQENRLANARTESSRVAAEMQNIGEALRRQGASQAAVDQFIRERTRARQTRLRSQFEDEAESLERQNRLLAESDQIQRQLLAVELDRQKAHERIFELMGNMSTTQRTRLQNAVDENARQRSVEVEQAPFRALAQQGGAAFEKSVGDALIAGLEGRREDFLAVWQSMAKASQRILIDSIFEASGLREGATNFFKELIGAVSGTSDATNEGAT